MLLSLWRFKERVALKNTDVRVATDVGIGYFNKISVVFFWHKLFFDNDFIPILTRDRVLLGQSLKINIVKPGETIAVELHGL
jgi:hypothetical protein